MQVFETEMIQGTFLKRNSAYTASIEIFGEVYSCYNPSSEKIQQKNCPCLVSVRNDLKRKTPFTLEAIQLDGAWKCINENRIEHLLKEEMEENIEILENRPSHQIISRIKDLITFQEKKILVDYKNVFNRVWKEEEKYWLEEGIHNGLKYVQVKLYMDPTCLKIQEVIDISEQFV